MTTNLVRVGGRLAVLGIGTNAEGTVNDTRFWHVMNPGTWNTPIVGGAHNAGLTVGRTLCGRHAWSNGYAADWKPPEGSMCPACAERS